MSKLDGQDLSMPVTCYRLVALHVHCIFSHSRIHKEQTLPPSTLTNKQLRSNHMQYTLFFLQSNSRNWLGWAAAVHPTQLSKPEGTLGR
jgi:hypothetical protein